MNLTSSLRLLQNVTLTAEALNLTNQTTNRWAYAEDRVVGNYGSSGRMFFVGARMSF